MLRTRFLPRRFFLLAAFILGPTFGAAGASQAQQGPACTQQTYGQTACFANKQCECIYQRGGSITGAPTGFKWDCGIERPACEVAPTSVIEYRGTPPQYPSSVTIDKSSQNVDVSQ